MAKEAVEVKKNGTLKKAARRVKKMLMVSFDFYTVG